jgi:hypothetical protein
MTAESTMKTTHLNFFYFLLRIYMDIYAYMYQVRKETNDGRVYYEYIYVYIYLNFIFYFFMRIYMHICIRCARRLMTGESTMKAISYTLLLGRSQALQPRLQARCTYTHTHTHTHRHTHTDTHTHTHTHTHKIYIYI